MFHHCGNTVQHVCCGGLNKYARWVKRSILQLPGKLGFHEYFEPESGKGLDASNFSWTAALVLETLSDEE